MKYEDVKIIIDEYFKKTPADEIIKRFEEMGCKFESIGKPSDKSALNITIVTHSNLELGRNVVDSEQNKGTIVNIDDLHNVEIDFEGGGKMIACFVEGCSEYKKDLEIIPVYYYG